MLHLHTDAFRSQQHGKAGKLMQRASASAVDMSRCLLSLRGGAAKRRQPRHRLDNAEDSSSSEDAVIRSLHRRRQLSKKKRECSDSDSQQNHGGKHDMHGNEEQKGGYGGWMMMNPTVVAEAGKGAGKAAAGKTRSLRAESSREEKRAAREKRNETLSRAVPSGPKKLSRGGSKETGRGAGVVKERRERRERSSIYEEWAAKSWKSCFFYRKSARVESRYLNESLKRDLKRRRRHFSQGGMLLHKAVGSVTNIFDLLATLSVRVIPLEVQDYRIEWKDPMPFFDYDEKFRMDKIKVENVSSLLFPRYYLPRVSRAPALHSTPLPFFNFVCSKIIVFLLEDECHGGLRESKDNRRAVKRLRWRRERQKGGYQRA
ncbi:hypothetical protein GUITHDRAFT_119773 [Guillardia theta CCMP2712]|uniref:Uncharacterized protein n=1 Tax=Guillardia theta (strain CCMP2712) TaxID=905079 RepID=L1ICS1_GUITC|nr:hypothetical protein GUITHDRAFT_119773 [Guillardia theta CCMP2712]EKX34033.1 hypothetical protein GUITHDRAFT_119773 [Guillardia theta CCMP2712]|eukprot:XP_005821013.1 hypothetical protein GUITHDRAFT_119773 [Guillardia theta CCMP2712]